MNESDQETIELRQAEAEMRRLNALFDQATTDLRAAVAEAEATGGNEADIRAALLARALAGEKFEVVTVPTSAARVAQLRELVGALAGAIETAGFRSTELLRRAIAADQPRQMEINQRRLAEGLAALGNTDAGVKRPRHNDDRPF